MEWILHNNGNTEKVLKKRQQLNLNEDYSRSIHFLKNAMQVCILYTDCIAHPNLASFQCSGDPKALTLSIKNPLFFDLKYVETIRA